MVYDDEDNDDDDDNIKSLGIWTKKCSIQFWPIQVVCAVVTLTHTHTHKCQWDRKKKKKVVYTNDTSTCWNIDFDVVGFFPIHSLFCSSFGFHSPQTIVLELKKKEKSEQKKTLFNIRHSLRLSCDVFIKYNVILMCLASQHTRAIYKSVTCTQVFVSILDVCVCYQFTVFKCRFNI